MFTPLLLGLAGSLHCVGMCGPLMLALPLPDSARRAVVAQILVYQTGRILSYSLLGVLFGLLGKGIAIAGFQQILSLLSGFFIIAMAVLAWRFERLVTALPGFGAFTRTIQHQLGKMMRRHGAGASFSVGMLNGLLPCGMVYAALAGAISTTDSAQGGIFMALFGVGTLPLLLTVNLAGRSLGFKWRAKMKVVQPILLTLAGILLLQRGLHLDLSLFESAVPKAGYECH
ncbi:MAG: sulfite exporter TauE/SafE family protein [Saprospiraceae bacterium]|nr:sulfite exporter TauE/SafE family protein [Saprospiraceae bacterium]